MKGWEEQVPLNPPGGWEGRCYRATLDSATYQMLRDIRDVLEADGGEPWTIKEAIVACVQLHWQELFEERVDIDTLMARLEARPPG